MKLKAFDEAKAALDNFTRTIKALFRVPKSAVREVSHKPRSRRKTAKAMN